jgi:hypothetical protein
VEVAAVEVEVAAVVWIWAWAEKVRMLEALLSQI